MPLSSKTTLRLIYVVAVCAFALWQVLLYQVFNFTFTASTETGLELVVITTFLLDIPLAIASIFWPRVGLIGIPANMALTVAYVLGALITETVGHRSGGWPGIMPLVILFAPKLILVGILALIERNNRTASRRVATPAPSL
jgi:hypothetical protein